RKIVIEEFDQEGKLRGTFDLFFERLDPKKTIADEGELQETVLTGTWKSATNEQSLPVYLRKHQGVSGDAKGGRCGLSVEQYKKLEDRVKLFHSLVIQKNSARLQAEFSYSKPIREEMSNRFKDIVPHSLFCNLDGFMLGSGVVWFDHDGKIIN
ncbi:MAG: hypothetical protein C0508_23415, partial [Cyanobacteria bacterium PR.023]|nr:hypothetical protein [Cyanobacteria bacterium PR.023]